MTTFEIQIYPRGVHTVQGDSVNVLDGVLSIVRDNLAVAVYAPGVWASVKHVSGNVSTPFTD